MKLPEIVDQIAAIVKAGMEEIASDNTLQGKEQISAGWGERWGG